VHLSHSRHASAVNYVKCRGIWYGYPPDELAAAVLQNSDTARGADGLTPQQANELVYLAKADLCPNY